ncbi:PREDICTED: magnesium transporter MRS2-I-like [Nicotiana attenuata]|uniref:magnesium transporter MRS2-I-like n=1 Tax=Nicotiana attenuata TaxID=49451 RepID=UPI0009046C1C|nr:PREDICTED: magnesium transporter MRS2-I-like [Nicotiana attenuata]
MKTGVSRSWILVDSKGESSILDLDKYAIMKRVPIHARDLRILDPLLSYPSAILGREKAIVLNLEHIKAIITTDEVNFFCFLHCIPEFELVIISDKIYSLRSNLCEPV